MILGHLAERLVAAEQRIFTRSACQWKEIRYAMDGFWIGAYRCDRRAGAGRAGCADIYNLSKRTEQVSAQRIAGYRHRHRHDRRGTQYHARSGRIHRSARHELSLTHPLLYSRTGDRHRRSCHQDTDLSGLSVGGDLRHVRSHVRFTPCDPTDTYNAAFVAANGGTVAGAEAALIAGLEAGKAYPTSTALPIFRAAKSAASLLRFPSLPAFCSSLAHSRDDTFFRRRYSADRA